jgi:hypothetical protein
VDWQKRLRLLGGVGLFVHLFLPAIEGPQSFFGLLTEDLPSAVRGARVLSALGIFGIVLFPHYFGLLTAVQSLLRVRPPRLTARNLKILLWVWFFAHVLVIADGSVREHLAHGLAYSGVAAVFLGQVVLPLWKPTADPEAQLRRSRMVAALLCLIFLGTVVIDAPNVVVWTSILGFVSAGALLAGTWFDRPGPSPPDSKTGVREDLSS